MAAWTAAAHQAANLARLSSPKSASTLQTANLVRRRGLAGGGGDDVHEFIGPSQFTDFAMSMIEDIEPEIHPNEMENPPQNLNDSSSKRGIEVSNVHPDNESDMKKPKNSRSEIWNHFSYILPYDVENPRATCHYCKKSYAAHPTRNGTTSMIHHFKNLCKKIPKEVDKGQKMLSFQTQKREDDRTTHKLVAVSFDAKRARVALAKMIIIDELSFRFIEGEGFKDFISEICPKFHVPSRQTISRDVFQLYLDEKKSLKNFFISEKQRVCLTSDCWTSIQNINYICLTTHYIDKDWKLQKRIIKFCQVENHKGDTIGRVIEQSLRDWGICKVFTITLDNASSNDTAVSYLKRKLKNWNDGLVMSGEFFHVRCCAHILNLIVREGLKDLHSTIMSIRCAVRYVRSSPLRLQKFKMCSIKENIESKGSVVLDVPTRWNSTYLMLKCSLDFQKAFDRLEEEEGINFISYFHEERSNVGPPTLDDWKNAGVFVKFLKTFYDSTLAFSASLCTTSNLYFTELHNIQSQILTWCVSDDLLLKNMAISMKTKFEKYWGNVDKTNKMLYVAFVLDPRYKLEYLKFLFEEIYDLQIVQKLRDNVKNTFMDLFKAYYMLVHGKEFQSNVTQSQDVIGRIPSSEEARKLKFLKRLEEKNSLELKTEVEKYLNTPCENVMLDKFDILKWWKANSFRFPIISLIARDVLAIQVSTVASESAFSTGGRILDPFRSSLNPKMVETLVCSQNWFRSSINNDNVLLPEYNDDLDIYEDVDFV